MIRTHYLSVICNDCRDAISLCNNEKPAKIEHRDPGCISVTCPNCAHTDVYLRDSIKIREFALNGYENPVGKKLHEAA